MAKDPAFLFYSSDFYTGTAFMTDEQVGKYIRLLCLQHQHGHLTEQHMINICKTYDEHIFAKFEKLPDGKYHNLRLHNEILKRNAYSESRRNNRLAKKDMSNICKSYDVAVSTHMENENRNKDINTDTKKGNAKGKQEYSSEVINIYNLYPAVDTNNNNRSTGKGSKDKDKIARMIKDIGYDQLKTRIENYLQNCNRSKEWLKNFSVLLNNLPEIVEMKNLPRKAMPCTL